MGIQTNYDIDIIIPTRNRGDLVALTVESILQNSYPHFKLWIIDQSKDKRTQEALNHYIDQDSRVHYIHTSSTGSNVARSIGLEAGSASYVLFTDDDCRVDKHWAHEMRQELLTAGTWAVFGRVMEDTTYKPIIPPKAVPIMTGGIKMALKDDNDRHIYKSNNRLNLGFGHGANMGINRARLQEIGGFDNMLGAGGPFRSWPERDLGYRILHHQGIIVYTPKSIVHHRHWRGWKDVYRTNKNYAYGAGAAIGKYWRSGDRSGALYLLAEWLLDQGIRQIISGALKWHSSQKIQIGVNHLIYPWQGLWESRKYPINKPLIIYQSPPLPDIAHIDIQAKKDRQ